MPTAPKSLTLSDLSDEDRKSLLEAAREEAKHNPTDVAGYDKLPKRDKAIRGLMDARDHVRDCPVAAGKILGRVEGFDATRPPNPAIGRPAAQLGVIRCIECGGQTVLEESLEAAIDNHGNEQ